MVRLARPAPAPLAPLPCRCRWAHAMVQVEEEASPLAAHCAWHLRRARFMSPLACAAMALLLLLRGAVAGGVVRVSRTALELELELEVEKASPCMRAAAQSIVHCCCVPDASYSPLNTKPLGSHSPWHSTRMASASASLSELTNRCGAEACVAAPAPPLALLASAAGARPPPPTSRRAAVRLARPAAP